MSGEGKRGKWRVAGECGSGGRGMVSGESKDGGGRRKKEVAVQSLGQIQYNTYQVQ